MTRERRALNNVVFIILYKEGRVYLILYIREGRVYRFKNWFVS